MNRFPTFENFDVVMDSGIVRITIDTTADHNALTETAFDELLELATQLNHVTSARCAVITGSGGAFSAGADIQGFIDNDDSGPWVRRMAEIFHSSIEAFHRADIPLVVGVNGVAVGGGFGIAMIGDLVLIHENAYLEYGYSRVGLPGDGGITYNLPRLVGVQKAKEIALLGRRIDPETAVELGLAVETVSDDVFDSRLDELAQEIASGPTRALGATKRLLTESLGNSIEEQLSAETEAMASTADTADHREGVDAFIEKRTPQFEGE